MLRYTGTVPIEIIFFTVVIQYRTGTHLGSRSIGTGTCSFLFKFFPCWSSFTVPVAPERPVKRYRYAIPGYSRYCTVYTVYIPLPYIHRDEKYYGIIYVRTVSEPGFFRIRIEFFFLSSDPDPGLFYPCVAEPEPVEPKLFWDLEPEPKTNLNKQFLQSVWRMLK